MKITKIILFCILLLALYISAYSVAYSHRHPAANMSYWMYTDMDDDEKIEEVEYYLFYPIYQVHKVLTKKGIARHNWDREPLNYPSNEF